MKTINVSIREMWNLRLLRFQFEFFVLNGNIYVTANIDKLKEIGY